MRLQQRQHERWQSETVESKATMTTLLTLMVCGSSVQEKNGGGGVLIITTPVQHASIILKTLSLRYTGNHLHLMRALMRCIVYKRLDARNGHWSTWYSWIRSLQASARMIHRLNQHGQRGHQRWEISPLRYSRPIFSLPSISPTVNIYMYVCWRLRNQEVEGNATFSLFTVSRYHIEFL